MGLSRLPAICQYAQVFSVHTPTPHDGIDVIDSFGRLYFFHLEKSEKSRSTSMPRAPNKAATNNQPACDTGGYWGPNSDDVQKTGMDGSSQDNTRQTSSLVPKQARQPRKWVTHHVEKRQSPGYLHVPGRPARESMRARKRGKISLRPTNRAM